MLIQIESNDCGTMLINPNAITSLFHSALIGGTDYSELPDVGNRNKDTSNHVLFNGLYYHRSYSGEMFIEITLLNGAEYSPSFESLFDFLSTLKRLMGDE